MKTKSRLLASILCVLMFALCVIGLSSCDTGKKCSHEWSEWSVTKKATCMEAQTEERKCEKCGVTQSQTSGEAVDHKDDNKDHICDYKCGKNDIEKHKDSQKDKDHDCDYCGESMEECTYPEGSTICDVCGKDKNAPPSNPSNPSNPSISANPNISYYTLYNSSRNVDRFSIVVNNLSYVAKDPDTSEIIGSIVQNGITEMEFYSDNKGINGAAAGKFVIFNGPVPNGDADCEFHGIIEENQVYVNIEIAEETAGIKMDLETLLNSSMSNANATASTYLLEFLNDAVIPTIDTLILLNPNDANDLLGDIYNMLYTFEKQSDGSYIATLDFNKVKTLNENLATKPVSEVIDLYFGENTFKGLVELSKVVLTLEPSEIPAYLALNRIDDEKLIDAFNNFIKNTNDYEDFDFEELINNDQFKGSKLGMLLYGVEDNSYIDIFNENIDHLNEISFYDLYNAGDLKEQINAIVDASTENISYSIVINRSGEFVSETIMAKDLPYGLGLVSFDMEIINDGEIEVTWSDIVDDIDENIVLPEEDMLPDGISSYAYDGEEGYITYEDEKYEYTDGYYVSAQQPLYDQLYCVMFMPGEDNQTMYTAYYSQKYYEFTLVTIDVDGNEVNLLRNEYDGEVVEIVQTNSGFKAIFEDGTEKSFNLNVNDDADEADAFAAIFFAVFEEPQGTVSAGDFCVEYIYDSETGTFEFN